MPFTNLIEPFLDRRMEHRIGAEKQLISNLGSSFDQFHVQLVNKTIDIKERFYHEIRKSHGVRVRSGRHVPRNDDKDYNVLFKSLDDTLAHQRQPGRRFGDYELPADITQDKRFDKANFYRWVTNKIKESKSIHEASNS